MLPSPDAGYFEIARHGIKASDLYEQFSARHGMSSGEYQTEWELRTGRLNTLWCLLAKARYR